MAACTYSKATHAIVGTFNGGGGIIEWQSNELDAYRSARALRKQGAVCEVVCAPGGEIDERGKAIMSSLMEKFFGFALD